MSKEVKKDEATAVAVVANETTAVTTASDIGSFYDEHSGDMDAMSRDDMALPFLRILQSNSPELDSNPKARPGMIYNTVTEEIFDEILVIPCHYRRSEIEWVPKNDGGGFVAEYKPEEAPQGVRDGGKVKLDNGHELQTTMTFSVLIMDGGVPQRAVITMSSTQLKKGRKWNTGISENVVTKSDGSMVRGSVFSYVWRLRGDVTEKNTKGTWKGWSIKRDAMVTSIDILKLALEFRKGCVDERVKVDYSQAIDDSTVEAHTTDTFADDDIGF